MPSRPTPPLYHLSALPFFFMFRYSHEFTVILIIDGVAIAFYIAFPSSFCAHLCASSLITFVLSLSSMGFFDYLQKKGSFAITPQKAQIRKVETKPAPSPSSVPSRGANSRHPPPQNSKSKPTDAKSRSKSRDSTRLQPRSSGRLGTPLNSSSRKRPSPALRLSSSDESDTEDIPDLRKRAKVRASAEPDLDRRVRSSKAFLEDGEQKFPMVHAADITSEYKAGKFSSAFDESTNPAEIELQYPSASQKER